MFDDDKPTHQERLQRGTHPPGLAGILNAKDPEPESGEANCPAFGYLRGIRDRADAVEFRFRDGNSVWFPYGWLGNWRYNPSDGLLLKFSGDMVYLVLIRGSNLDRPLGDGTIDLMRAGLQRHRIIWVREMTKEEIAEIGASGPTIDQIEVGEFQSNDDLKEWVGQRAPALLR